MPKGIKKNADGRLIDEGPVTDPVTFAEYLRRKNALVKSKNPLAPTIYFNALSKALKGGYIKVFEQGGNVFIDWDKYSDYVFRTSVREKKISV